MIILLINFQTFSMYDMVDRETKQIKYTKLFALSVAIYLYIDSTSNSTNAIVQFGLWAKLQHRQ